MNRGTIEAHESGIVTSASLMVRWPAAAASACYARAHRELSLGLHVDLGEWGYRCGSWVSRYQVVALDDPGAVADEVYRQITIFRGLVREDPTHIDSHQHVHIREPVRSVLSDIAKKLDVPLRHESPGIRYCGDFYGQTASGFPLPDVITVEGLLRILATLPQGVIELGCHPGTGDDPDSMYVKERAEEVQVLCDTRIRTAIAAEGIELCSFRTIGCSTRVLRHDSP